MLRAKKHLMSLGYLSQQLQKSPQTIEKILDEKGISPEITINGIAHFDENAYCVLADWIEGKRQ